MAIIEKSKAEELIARYPEKRSAMLPLLWAAQNKSGWVTPDAVEEIAALLDVSLAEVWGVVSFYTMFRRKPVGKYVFSLCNNLSCSICNADELVRYVENKLGIKDGETTADGKFSIETMECIGACAEAPAMLLNDVLYGNLTKEKIDKILDDLRKK